MKTTQNHKFYAMAWTVAAIMAIAASPMTVGAEASDETTPATTTYCSTVFTGTTFTTATTPDISYLTAGGVEVSKTCVSDSDLPVFFTDENGHQFYRGTNCLNKVYLLLPSNAKTTYAIGEVLDLSQLKLILVEERRFNIYHYDVTGEISLIATDFDSTKAGTYFVTISTSYLSEVWSYECDPIEPITFEVTVDENLPKVTTPPSDQLGSVLTETTTVTSTAEPIHSDITFGESSIYDPPKYLDGDINRDGETTISDAIIHANFCAENDNLSEEEVSSMVTLGDIDQNGLINTDDTTLIIYTIAKLM